MEEKDVLRFLRCESSDLVKFAVKMANLTWKEELAITLCGRKDKTQNQAAEESGFSVDTLQKWYRRGIEKLGKSWGGVWWIQKILEKSPNFCGNKQDSIGSVCVSKVPQ